MSSPRGHTKALGMLGCPRRCRRHKRPLGSNRNGPESTSNQVPTAFLVRFVISGSASRPTDLANPFQNLPSLSFAVVRLIAKSWKKSEPATGCSARILSSRIPVPPTARRPKDTGMRLLVVAEILRRLSKKGTAGFYTLEDTLR